MAALGAPASSTSSNVGAGARAVVVAPTRELAHQIHNECLKLAVGRKWRIVLFSKSTASTLSDKNVRDKVGLYIQSVVVQLAQAVAYSFYRRYHNQHTVKTGCLTAS